MNPSIDKIKKIAAALLAKTQASELEWEETETEDVFQVAFSGHSIRVRHKPTQTFNANHYFLAIHNEQGAMIEEAGDFEVDGAPYPATESPRMLKDLYERARRKAMGVDKALDDILSELE